MVTPSPLCLVCSLFVEGGKANVSFVLVFIQNFLRPVHLHLSPRVFLLSSRDAEVKFRFVWRLLRLWRWLLAGRKKQGGSPFVSKKPHPSDVERIRDSYRVMAMVARASTLCLSTSFFIVPNVRCPYISVPPVLPHSPRHFPSLSLPYPFLIFLFLVSHESRRSNRNGAIAEMSSTLLGNGTVPGECFFSFSSWLFLFCFLKTGANNDESYGTYEDIISFLMMGVGAIYFLLVRHRRTNTEKIWELLLQ